MRFLKSINFFMLVPVLGLGAISLAIIASTTPSLFTQQLIFNLVGLFLYFVFASIDFRVWPKFTWLFFSLSLILLIITFLGTQVRGSSRWIDLGWFRLQPSELIKPFFVLMIAGVFSQSKAKTISMIYKPLLFFIPIIFLIFRQPDLGNVLVYTFIFLTVGIISGIPLWSILTGLSLFTIFLPLAWFLLKEYQKIRLLSFLDPHSDPAGAGYNAMQAIIAIGSGQLGGLGLGHGTQSHLLFLPEYHTDFIFASIGEELGFVGSFIVLVFYLILLGNILMVASRQSNSLGRLITTGIFAQLFIQVFINIGMNLGILPITGITLPLLSYGGSSVISTFIGLGIVSNIWYQAQTHPAIVIK